MKQVLGYIIKEQVKLTRVNSKFEVRDRKFQK